MGVHYLDWPAPQHVKACFTEREGGYSLPPYDSFNLALHVDDEATLVLKNRDLLVRKIQVESVQQNPIHWLEQVHSTRVVNLDQSYSAKADAGFTRKKGQVCCVMTADCLPVFLCDSLGQQVAVAHAGWRGLCNGVLQNTVNTFKPKQELMAYLGPAISQSAFEVGDEVRCAFLEKYPDLNINDYFISVEKTAAAGKQHSAEIKWMGDLYGIAREILTAMGVKQIYGGDRCTFTEEDKFFSYRRNAKTGRMANLIWLE